MANIPDTTTLEYSYGGFPVLINSSANTVILTAASSFGDVSYLGVPAPPIYDYLADAGTVTAVADLSGSTDTIADAPPTSTTTVTDGTLGNNATHESYVTDIVYVEAYTLTTSAIVQSYQWQGKGDNSHADQHWKFLIYLDNGGVPGALLYVSDEQTVSSVGSTVTTQTISPTALSIPSGTLWVGVHLNEGHLAPTYTHGGNAMDASDEYDDGPNDPFSGGGNTNDNLRDRLLTYIPNAANVALVILTGSSSLSVSASASATVTAVAVLSGAEVLMGGDETDSGSVTAVAVLSGAETLTDSVSLTAVAVLSVSDALADVGDDLPTGTLRLNNFESGSNGATISTSNSGNGSRETTAFDAVTTPVIYDTTHAHSGTKAAKFTTAGSAGSVQYRSLGNLTDGYVRLYVYLTAYPSGAAKIHNFISSAAATRSVLYIEPSGVVAMSNNAGTEVITGVVPVNLNGWTRIEAYIHGDASVGQVEFKVFLTADSATPDEVQTSAANVNTGGTFDRAVFGPAGNANHAASWWVDDVGFSDQGYLGPMLAPYPVTGIAVPSGTSQVVDSTTVTATVDVTGVGSVAKIDSGLVISLAGPFTSAAFVSPLIFSGSLTSVVVLSDAERAVDTGSLTAVAVPAGADNFGERATVTVTAVITVTEFVGDGAVTAAGVILSDIEALVQAALLTAIADPEGSQQSVGDGQNVFAVTVLGLEEALADEATEIATADITSPFASVAWTMVGECDATAVITGFGFEDSPTGSKKGFAYPSMALRYRSDPEDARLTR